MESKRIRQLDKNALIRLMAGLMMILFGFIRPAQAVAQSTKAAATAAPTAEAFLAFVRTYQQALLDKNAPFLREHVRFPLSVPMLAYNMETKYRKQDLPTVKELFKHLQDVQLPTAFLADKTDLATLHIGIQKCDQESQQANTMADFTQGDAAFVLKGSTLELSYLAEPCDSITHIRTLVVTHGRKGFQVMNYEAHRLPPAPQAVAP